MSLTFKEFNLSPTIQKSLDEMGYINPTEVQSRVIPKVLAKEDLIVISKTGSGKTGAFGIPMLEALERDENGPKALILTPTRELAVQVDADLKAMSKYKSIKTTVLYGGHGIGGEIERLAKGVDIVTGTAGRVFDHMTQGNLKTGNIQFLVLDEADRMLDMGFIDQVKRIVKKIPDNRVTLLFSATIPPEVQKLCVTYMKNPDTIEIESETKTVDTITQFYYKVEHNEKRKQLHRILTVEQPESCMVFCNTRMTVDKVNEFLQHKGYTSKALHGANSQTNRMKSIQQFKKGDFEVLVATDVAARGIHVDDLSLVVNYDVPQDKDNYIHRIGRTGRAGNGGRAITLVTKDDQYTLYEIEEHVGVLIPQEELPTDEQVNAMPKRTPKPYVQKEHEVDSKRKPHGPRKPHESSKPQEANKTHESRKPHHSTSSSVSNKSQGARKPYEPRKPYEQRKPYESYKPIEANPINGVDKTKVASQAPGPVKPQVQAITAETQKPASFLKKMIKWITKK